MRYDNIVGEDTFVGQYLKHMSTQETPVAYDFWCAMWLLSLACGRNVIVARPRAPVYLNLYAILVANSGVTRKSSAVNYAGRLAKQFIEQDPIVGMIETKITPEALDVHLHKRTEAVGSAQVAINVSELATFLGTEKYNAAMPALLTDLYDCSETRLGGGTINRGVTNQRRIWCSFLSASTPSWLFRSVNPNIVEGGFTSRCIFVVCETGKGHIAWPDADDNKAKDGEANLLAALKVYAAQGKQFKTITLNATALKDFRAWYKRRQASIDPFTASFESREDAHILRLAALLCINDNSWVVQSSHVKTATKVIAQIKADATTLFSGTGSQSKFMLAFERLRDKLLAVGRDTISRSELYLSVRAQIKNSDFDAMLDVLHEMGGIQVFEKPREGAGRPTMLIRGTALLTAKKFTAQLREAFKD